MGLPWNVNASMGGAGVNYQIQRSLRLRSSATAYLNKTFSSSGTDLRKWTLSFWMKRGALSVQSVPFSCQDTPGTGASSVYFLIGSGNTIGVFYPNTGANLNVGTAAVLRDPSAWYHVLFAFDTTQATSTDRIKIYINGVQQTLSGGGTYPTLNSTTTWNSNCPHFISKNPVSSSDYFDGYFAEIYNIDGQALTPASFGYNDPVTGVWQPAPFKGTYGTNGFYLPFTDIATTSGSNFGLGRDYSGNANYFNTNNISVTSGATYDSMIDSPTSFSDGTGIYNRGNYCTLSPIDYQTAAPTNGNLTLTNGFARATVGIPSSGKWYWENTIGSSSNNSCGLSPASSSLSDANGGSGFYAYYLNGQKYTAGTASAYGASYTSGDVISVAVDADAGTVTFYKNNVSQGVAFSGLSFANPWLPLARPITTATTDINFGQRPFTYTPPTGFKALNTFNLPTPTIPNGAAYMAATLYTGNGTSQSITNSQNNGGNNSLGKTFYADFLIQKARSSATDNIVYDTNRGANYLVTNSTAAEVASGIIALNSTGFNVGSGTAVNANGVTYVGWQWNAGSGATVSNTSGTITSTVSANTTAGFSVVTMTYSSVAGTVGHGLGVAPSMIIVKRRDSTGNWFVAHSGLTNMSGYYLLLESTAAQGAASWGGSPTSTVFYMSNSIFASGNYVAYCFAAVRGYSAFGSYTGNGSTDGPFIYTGFRPRWIMVKSSTDAGSWTIMDTSRLGYNANNSTLYADLTSVEQGYLPADILSNGFKIRITSTGTSFNTSGQTYVYAAFAENPFNYSRGR